MMKNLFRRTAALALAALMLLSGCSPAVQSPGITPAVSEADVSASDDSGEDQSLYIPAYEDPEIEYDEGSTPVERHGALYVDGPFLMDESGSRYQLYGMSTHGIAWYPQYVNYDAFLTLRDEWNINCVRLSMYTTESGGYCGTGDKNFLKRTVREGVDYATELGMYVIVDWHVLKDENPLLHMDDALEFFAEISSAYADNDNVIYEICSEPSGATTWSDVSDYANEVIPVIRANDSDALIIVGTPSWSQDIDKALESPLEYDNIMYALHFYAGTHKYWLRSKLEDCITGGLPVFISEFGTCDSTGRGDVDHSQSEAWKELIDYYNLSYIAWNLANKNETCSVIKTSCKTTSGWTDDDLTEHGLLVKGWFTGEPNQ